MTEDMNEILLAVLLIVVGWLFGLLSPIITNYNSRIRNNTEILSALRVEMDELKFRLAASCYRINIHLGAVNRELLEWIEPILSNYTGINPSKLILDSIRSQLQLSDEQIANFVDTTKADSEIGLSLKKYNIPLLETNYSHVPGFSNSMQNKLIELRTNINMLNEEVDQARYYFNLTFKHELSDNNRDIVSINLKNTYTQYAALAKKIADQLDTIK